MNKDTIKKSLVNKFKKLSKKQKYIMFGIIIAIISIVVIGICCSENKLVGTWNNGDIGYLIFTEDGRYFIENDDIQGTYEQSNRFLYMKRSGKEVVEPAEYDIKDNILTITDENGKTRVFYRIK